MKVLSGLDHGVMCRNERWSDWMARTETVVRPDSTTDRIDYVWGKDISGSLDGAAGIGGLLYVRLNGAIFVPFYDAYGNVMGYRDAEGNTVAEYVYDAFGRTVAQNGTISPQQDIEMLKQIRTEIPNPPLYSFFFNNCIQWSNRVLRYGMEK